MSCESAIRYCELVEHHTVRLMLLFCTITIDDETCEIPRSIPTTELALTQPPSVPAKPFTLVVMLFEETNIEEFESTKSPVVVRPPQTNPPNA